jgi:hypothetical protein
MGPVASSAKEVAAGLNVFADRQRQKGFNSRERYTFL